VIAAPRDRLNERWRGIIVAHKLAKLIDGGRHGRLAQDARTPHLAKQRVAAHRPVGVHQEVREKIEDSRANRDGVTFPPEFARGQINLELSEGKNTDSPRSLLVPVKLPGSQSEEKLDSS
jgi:hypothetical protein